MTTFRLPVAIASSFIWIGFIGAISFMEAWLKFRAPGVTTPLGLGIGRIVFGALNKVEWILALIIACMLIFSKMPLIKGTLPFFLIPVLIIVLQTFWLLPALDTRAQLHIDGSPVPPSALHIWYVAMEAVKIICLLGFGHSLFKIGVR